ncbi:unnamed protein product [Schistosoma turkestanicum]|nr:unnamed protein product [Schistosoma turkestanicum]CAH8597640.1 unnamed protein product [Schistosoma turkestanicum]
MIASWFISIVLIHFVVSEPFLDCGSQVGKIFSLTVTPCDRSPCALYKGKNSTITIEFSTTETVVNGKIAVHGVFAHVPIPFPLPNSNLCEFVSPVCPLLPSIEKYTHTYTLPVQHMYPSISLKVRWELKDSSSKDIVCIEFPVQII